MDIKVLRYSKNLESTLDIIMINNVFECYGLEDEKRTRKVFGETRIPDGKYKIGLRTVGGTHARYSKKFGFHKGMLHILDVPNFEYILIHIGNTDDDTAGCLLLGNTVNNNKIEDGFLGGSTNAYIKFYKKVLSAIEKGEKITIEFKEIEA